MHTAELIRMSRMGWFEGSGAPILPELQSGRSP
jgi:hypothetical protein